MCFFDVPQLSVPVFTVRLVSTAGPPELPVTDTVVSLSVVLTVLVVQDGSQGSVLGLDCSTV